MKILFLILLISCSLYAQHKYFQIEKNTQGGFNIFDNSDELLYKYTKQNTDSFSLETLNNIFFKTKALTEIPTKVEITNIPENSFWQIIFPLISVLSGVMIGWILSYFSQKRLIREQFLLHQKENQLNDFINVMSEFNSYSFFYRHEFIQRWKDLLTNNEQIGYFTKDVFYTQATEIMKKGYKISSILNSDNEVENKLLELISEFLSAFRVEFKDVVEIDKLDKTLKDYTEKIAKHTENVIENKKNLLKNINKY